MQTNSEVKKSLKNTGSNQEKKKGLASLQTPEMTSMGFQAPASSAVNYDTCDDSEYFRGGNCGGHDVKSVILSLFKTLEENEQKELLEELAQCVQSADSLLECVEF